MAITTALQTVHLCVPDDQVRHLPKRRRAPEVLPANVPLPRMGEVVFLSRSSAWAVQLVVHEWHAPDTLRVEVWLEFINSGGRHARPTGQTITQ